MFWKVALLGLGSRGIEIVFGSFLGSEMAGRAFFGRRMTPTYAEGGENGSGCLLMRFSGAVSQRRRMICV
jgi:hypothetical protein